MHYRRICFFILLFGFIGASTVYSWDKDFFENIEQPIAFPHKLHVVNNGISCEYCHSSARNSVNAGIPPVRTCIGCLCIGCHSLGERSQDCLQFEELELQGAIKSCR